VSIPGAVFTGWVYDQTESYTYALIPMAISYGVAALVMWRMPQPRRRPRRAASASGALDEGEPAR